ncbi:DUF1365 domain-containing protein [Aquisalimonas asiatica]|uniref:DUF1365 domain-containing protein n=1 Tax=Aquisalimonas asiatica TaxID=406100 RepID=A0A1H8TND5_9GAMM|nr:DUF1365 domain-containing protein [Aquisalimonas asiatica]SEO92043.1 hypothetical protein SAMN04488052_104312 [Aquisalimonas asiatica]
MTTRAGALYTGAVMHRRYGRPGSAFRYRLFGVLLDIDRIDDAVDGLRLLSHNRFNLFSFLDRDHGPRDGSALRPWIDAILARAAIDLQGGQVLLYGMPRMLGYGFNPLSLWYCHHRDGALLAVLCEVRNTFGEWHGYLLHDSGAPLHTPVRSRASKCFHVSPFFPVSGEYRFRLTPPGETFTTTIHYHDQGSLRLAAVQQGERRPLSDAELLRAGARHPFMTLKVMAAIHWQALKIWLRGARFHRKPERPSEDIT